MNRENNYRLPESWGVLETFGGTRAYNLELEGDGMFKRVIVIPSMEYFYGVNIFGKDGIKAGVVNTLDGGKCALQAWDIRTFVRGLLVGDVTAVEMLFGKPEDTFYLSRAADVLVGYRESFLTLQLANSLADMYKAYKGGAKFYYDQKDPKEYEKAVYASLLCRANAMRTGLQITNLLLKRVFPVYLPDAEAAYLKRIRKNLQTPEEWERDIKALDKAIEKAAESEEAKKLPLKSTIEIANQVSIAAVSAHLERVKPVAEKILENLSDAGFKH